MNKTQIILTVAVISVGGYLLYRSFKKKAFVGADGVINYAAREKALKSGKFREDEKGNIYPTT